MNEKQRGTFARISDRLPEVVLLRLNMASHDHEMLVGVFGKLQPPDRGPFYLRRAVIPWDCHITPSEREFAAAFRRKNADTGTRRCSVSPKMDADTLALADKRGTSGYLAFAAMPSPTRWSG